MLPKRQDPNTKEEHRETGKPDQPVDGVTERHSRTISKPRISYKSENGSETENDRRHNG